VAAALDDVPAGVALAEARRHERAADQRHADLPAVQVARHGERNAVGHAREEVGVVACEDRRGAVGHVAQRPLDVGGAVARVLDARDPDVAGAHRVVLEHGDAGGAQGGAHAGAVVAPVVVAQDGDDAERGPQCREAPGDGRGRDARTEAHLGVDVVAEEQDEVGPLRIDRRDEARDALRAHVRRPGVEVGHERDAQAVERDRPALAEVELALADAAAARLLPEGAPGDRADREAGAGDTGCDGAAGALHARGG